jgi:hypothetical protein
VFSKLTSGHPTVAREGEFRNLGQNRIILARNSGNVVLEVVDARLCPDAVQAGPTVIKLFTPVI